MTKENAIREIDSLDYYLQNHTDDYGEESHTAMMMAISVLRNSRKGEWKRMSDLPEDKDDRYECSYCGNVIHHKSRMNLYTFNSWCGRCGSLNNPSRYEQIQI